MKPQIRRGVATSLILAGLGLAAAQAKTPDDQYVTLTVGEQCSTLNDWMDNSEITLSNDNVRVTSYWANSPESGTVKYPSGIYITFEGVYSGECTLTLTGDGETVIFHITVLAVTPAPIFNLVPCYVFWSKAGTPFYTASEDEKNLVLSHPEWGWTLQGIAYYVYQKEE